MNKNGDAVNAERRGMLKNCTREILARQKPKPAQMIQVLRPVDRMLELGGGLVVPKYGTVKYTK